ncbi:MAG: hypothetical protein QM775_30895 [Pirellulales bacterium]
MKRHDDDLEKAYGEIVGFNSEPTVASDASRQRHRQYVLRKLELDDAVWREILRELSIAQKAKIASLFGAPIDRRRIELGMEAIN